MRGHRVGGVWQFGDDGTAGGQQARLWLLQARQRGQGARRRAGETVLQINSQYPPGQSNTNSANENKYHLMANLLCINNYPDNLSDQALNRNTEQNSGP